jgi:Pyruvate/2-oxoacid:ferredoxin oxidoreductase delta subunit
MGAKKLNIHYVCTQEQARKLAKPVKRFWVSNCGCREERGGKCTRSRIDVCLYFRGDAGSSGTGLKEINRAGADAIFKEAKDKHLVARPFRNDKNPKIADGICFCCDDCCGYFLDPKEKCDKGNLVETTDMAQCTQCGVCADVCFFKARTMETDGLAVNRDKCYGCGLCADICPMKCIQLNRR